MVFGYKWLNVNIFNSAWLQLTDLSWKILVCIMYSTLKTSKMSCKTWKRQIDVLPLLLKAVIPVNPWIFFMTVHMHELINSKILSFHRAQFDYLIKWVNWIRLFCLSFFTRWKMKLWFMTPFSAWTTHPSTLDPGPPKGLKVCMYVTKAYVCVMYSNLFL